MALGVVLFLMSISLCFSADNNRSLGPTSNEFSRLALHLNPKSTEDLHEFYIVDKASLTSVSAVNTTLPTSSIGYINNLALLILIIVLLFVCSLNPKCNPLKNRTEKQKLGERYLNSDLYQTPGTNHPDNIPPFKPDDKRTHLENVLANGCSTLNCDTGLIVVLNQTTDLLEISHLFSRQSTQLRCNTAIKLKHTLFEDIFNNTAKVKTETLHDCAKMRIKDIDVNAYIGAKLFVNHQFYGLLCFITHEPRPNFSTHDVESFTLMTYWITDILESEFTINRLETEKETATKTNRAKSSFLASMSHEIRTPLTAITGYSEMLLEDIHEACTDQCIDDVHSIQKASKHLLKLINDILDLSKIEAGKIEVYLDLSDISFLVNDILEFCQTLAAKNNNKINYESAKTPLKITTDSTLLRQCLLNLIANACKFTKNGDISIAVTEHHIPTISNTNVDKDCRWVYVSVKDTGIGISEKSLSMLFKDFSQVDDVNVANYGGSGLGLAISDRMCRLLGGEISVESELNKGSTFTIKIPDFTNTRP